MTENLPVLSVDSQFSTNVSNICDETFITRDANLTPEQQWDFDCAKLRRVEFATKGMIVLGYWWTGWMIEQARSEAHYYGDNLAEEKVAINALKEQLHQPPARLTRSKQIFCSYTLSEIEEIAGFSLRALLASVKLPDDTRMKIMRELKARVEADEISIDNVTSLIEHEVEQYEGGAAGDSEEEEEEGEERDKKFPTVAKVLSHAENFTILLHDFYIGLAEQEEASFPSDEEREELKTHLESLQEELLEISKQIEAVKELLET